MATDTPAQIVDAVCKAATSLRDVALTAERNKQSLAGNNFYGQKFHELSIESTQLREDFAAVMTSVGLDDDAADTIEEHLNTLVSEQSSTTDRQSACRALALQIRGVMTPRLRSLDADPTPKTEKVLPQEVVANTRTYLERVIKQANGCYERQWYDACSVMIRRFVETMIVEVYEAHEKADEIEDGDGNYVMLRDLIKAILSEKKAWKLSRETKATLPLVKNLGDRAAHNRRYVATKADVDNIIPGFRIVAQDLLSIANIEKQ